MKLFCVVQGQIFYTAAAALSLVSLFVTVLGVFLDLINNKVVLPAALSIATFVSCAGQLIAVSVYGGIGIRDHTRFEPDYSFILACVSIAVDLVAAFLFGAEAMFFHNMYS
jgi:hypothetical protein